MANERANQTTEAHVGFTGSRHGMTTEQSALLAATLTGDWLHHGDCIGSDQAVHRIAVNKGMRVAVHPPSNGTLRAYCSGNIIHAPKDYLIRNRDIVDAADRLIAAPATMTEERRSGTWSTVRYARRTGKPVSLFFPDGSVSHE